MRIAPERFPSWSYKTLLIRQALTIAVLSAVILMPVAASAQRGGGAYARDRSRPPPGLRGYDRARPDPAPRALPDQRVDRGDRRAIDPRCADSGSGGLIGAIASGLLGNSANGRTIERASGRCD
jgi:hypothetical protein